MTRLKLPLLYISLLGLLVIRITWLYSTLPVRHNGDVVQVQGKLTSEPKVNRGSYVIDLENTKVYLPASKPVHYGDYVLIRGIWRDYYIDKPELTRGKQSKVKQTEGTRQKLRETYFSILKPRAADIVSGMVLGSDEMDANLKNELASSGLIHLVVASGMNLTLLGGFLIAIFTSFRINRTASGAIISLAVIMYAGLTGFNPPIVRALIMFEAVLLGGLVGRRSGGIFGLITAGYIMLWVNPTLMTSYSFLLSFASMASQIFLSTVKVSLPEPLKATVLVVLQNFLALVFTAPIILIGFAKFSLISIVSNLMVVLTIEPLMILGGFAGIVGLSSKSLSSAILTPVAYILDYFLWVVEIFGRDNKFVMEVAGFNMCMAVGYYMMLFSLIYLFSFHKRT